MFDFAKLISPEERKRFRLKEEKAEARTVQVQAVRTDAFTEQVKTVQVSVRLETHRFSEGTEDYIHVLGGPTGYESMPFKSLDRAIEAGGWLACFGTPGRYDRLLIPAEQLQILKSSEGVLRRPHE